MYVLILILLIAAGTWFIRQGFVGGNRSRILTGVAVLGLGAAFFGLLSQWGELLWFESLGLERRFWLFLCARAGALVAGAAVAAALAAAITWPVHERRVR